MLVVDNFHVKFRCTCTHFSNLSNNLVAMWGLKCIYPQPVGDVVHIVRGLSSNWCLLCDIFDSPDHVYSLVRQLLWRSIHRRKIRVWSQTLSSHYRVKTVAIQSLKGSPSLVSRLQLGAMKWWLHPSRNPLVRRDASNPIRTAG